MDLMGAKEQCVCEDYRRDNNNKHPGGRSTKEEAKRMLGDEANRRIKNDGILWHFFVVGRASHFLCLEKTSFILFLIHSSFTATTHSQHSTLN
jgi:hypothetical protein